MEFYNDKYECTYRLSESTEEYQKDLLNVVDMRNNYTTAPDSRTVDTEAIVEKISKIYTEMDDKEMAEIYKYCKENIIYLQDCNDDICFIFLFGYDVMIMMYLDLSRCITSISAKLTDDSAQMSSKYGYEILSEFIFSYTFFIS